MLVHACCRSLPRSHGSRCGRRCRGPCDGPSLCSIHTPATPYVAACVVSPRDGVRRGCVAGRGTRVPLPPGSSDRRERARALPPFAHGSRRQLAGGERSATAHLSNLTRTHAAGSRVPQGRSPSRLAPWPQVARGFARLSPTLISARARSPRAACSLSHGSRRGSAAGTLAGEACVCSPLSPCQAACLPMRAVARSLALTARPWAQVSGATLRPLPLQHPHTRRPFRGCVCVLSP